jgi:hypothetical protein
MVKTREAGAGGLKVQGQPRLSKENLSQKKKKSMGDVHRFISKYFIILFKGLEDQCVVVSLRNPVAPRDACTALHPSTRYRFILLVCFSYCFGYTFNFPR